MLDIMLLDQKTQPHPEIRPCELSAKAENICINVKRKVQPHFSFQNIGDAYVLSFWYATN